MSSCRSGAARFWTAPLDRRGVVGMSRVILNGLWTMVDQAELNSVRECGTRSTVAIVNLCSWDVF